MVLVTAGSRSGDGLAIHAVEPLVAEVRDARRELQAPQVEQTSSEEAADWPTGQYVP
jgi:hypothetical protein